MINEFSRIQFLIGEGGLSKLSPFTVMISGVGGVGSRCIETLVRCDTGRLALVDPDKVALTNINRQSIVYHSTVGQFKTKMMKRRIMDINPAAQAVTFEGFILPKNLEQLPSEILRMTDYVVDVIDTVAAKLALVEYYMAREIPLLASMGTGNKLHGGLSEIIDISKTSVCLPCRVMRRELKSREICHLEILYSKGEPLKPKFESERVASRCAIPGSISFVPPVAGLLITEEVVGGPSGS